MTTSAVDTSRPRVTAPGGVPDPFPGDSAMAARCRALDWAATPLGPVEHWPVSLRTTVATLLGSRHPMFLFWGPELVQVYNDAYRPSFGGDEARADRAVGARGAAFWTEIWDAIGPQIAQVMAGGPATWHEDQRLVFERHGRLEDAWWTCSYSPAYGDDGRVAGVLVVCQETTARVREGAERARLAAALDVERARLAAVFRQSPSFLAVLRGPANVFELVNDAYLQLVGRGRDVLGKPLFDALPEARGQGFDALLGQVRATGAPLVFRDLPVLLDRTPGAPGAERVLEERFMDITYLPLAEADGAGRVTHDAVIAHGTDVTDQVRARAAVAESERRFRTLADAIPAIAWTARADGYVDWNNARFYAYTGVTPAAAEGAGWTAVVHPDDLPRVAATWEAAVAAGTPVEQTFRIRGADGGYRQFLTRALPVRDGDRGGDADAGRVVRWVGTNTDVEDERAARAAVERARAEAEAAQREAEAANQSKAAFLATMSHELRTPPNAIAGYAELIELGVHGPVTAEQRAALERIQRAQRHLLGLITGVLDYARVEAGAVHYAVSDFALDEVLATCEALVAPQARARGLTLERAADPAPVRARADREKMQQVVINLLSNAVKFTEPGGRIALASAAENGVVHVVVRDTGVGIAADQLARVFEPFVQVGADRTRTREGTGLGLAISRDLARGMGGDLTAESTPGVGSTFTLTLPAGSAPAGGAPPA